jgi:hypothetical protein
MSEQTSKSGIGLTNWTALIDPDHTWRRRRRIGFAMIAAGGLLLLGGLWIGVTAVMARGQLNEVRAEAHTLETELSASNWSAARTTAANLANSAHRANQLTSGPAWAVAAALPSGGEPLKTIRGITAAADTIGAKALPQLLNATQVLNPRTLREPDGDIDLARIAAIAPALHSASVAVAQATNTMSALPDHTWLSSIDTSYASAMALVSELNNGLTAVNLTARILPTMLGQAGPKYYFLAFQNEAESRGTGGLPGAFGIIEANHGKLSFVRMESDTTLARVSASVDFGPAYDHLYAAATPTLTYGNSNISPNFPYAAQIWASMWRNHSGQKVDGVIAVDPTALSYLLDVTGPATLPDNSQISGANAIALTQSSSYAMFPGTSEADVAQRQAYLLEVASAASKQILADRGEPTALVEAAAKAAGERRILVWSADPTIEAQLAQTTMAGVIPITTAPYVGMSIVNGGGDKLDYYLDRSITWQAVGCGSTRATTVTITLTNDAPATGLPDYVTGRSDTRSYPVKVGDNRLEVSYFATQGAVLHTVTVANQPGKGLAGIERGHPVYTIDVELPRGTSRTIVMHLSEPASPAAPIVLDQPLVRPLEVTLKNAVCN